MFRLFLLSCSFIFSSSVFAQSISFSAAGQFGHGFPAEDEVPVIITDAFGDFSLSGSFELSDSAELVSASESEYGYSVTGSMQLSFVLGTIELDELRLFVGEEGIDNWLGINGNGMLGDRSFSIYFDSIYESGVIEDKSLIGSWPTAEPVFREVWLIESMTGSEAEAYGVVSSSDVSPVPVPAAMWLFASALMALGLKSKF